jgi:hypothetical protein
MVHTLPFSDIHVPTPGFGAMGMSFGLGSNLSLEEAEPVLLKALEIGCTFWLDATFPRFVRQTVSMLMLPWRDTAVVYQAGVNEKLLGDFIRKHNCRDKIFRRSSLCTCGDLLTIPQSLQNADLMSSGLTARKFSQRSPTSPTTLRTISKGRLNG